MTKPRLKMLGSRLQVAAPVRKEITPGAWSDGKTTAERGYGYRWQQARKSWLRDNPLCVMCKAEGYAVPATVVDHTEAHRGDQRIFWDKTKWQSLCKMHHDSHAQKRDNELLR
ncbi:MAG: hypothetical protein ACOYBW_08910 [Fluviibacter phosphoraccumulans]